MMEHQHTGLALAADASSGLQQQDSKYGNDIVCFEAVIARSRR